MKTLLAVTLATIASPTLAAAPPAVGDSAPTVTLKDSEGQAVDLAEAFGEGKTVLVVLRGYPGYQCPLCSRQATDYLREAEEFRDRGARVLMVYPGAADGLDAHAEEFLNGVARQAERQELPKNVSLLLDPDFELIEAYGLRWDAPNETAYPATFVIDGGQVVFATVSDSHGGRVSVEQALEALDAPAAAAAP